MKRISIKFYSNVKKNLLNMGLSFLIFILSLILIFPFLSLIPISFDISLNTLKNLILNNSRLYIAPSFLMLFSVVVITTIIAIIAAWIVAFHEFPFVSFFRFAFVLPLAIPIYINGITYAFIFEQTIPNAISISSIDIKNIYGVIFIMSISLYPYVYLILYNRFKRFDDFVTIARINGKNNFDIFIKIILPNSKYAILLGMLLVATETLSEFGVIKYYNVKSFTTGIYNNWFFWGNYQNAGIISLMLIIVTLILSYLHSVIRQNKKYDESSDSKSLSKDNYITGWHAMLAVLICIIIVFISFAFPLLQILIWIIESKFTYLDKYFLRSLTNSIFISSVASAIIMMMSIFLIYLKYSEIENKLARLLLTFFNSNYIPPGTVIAIGVLTIGVVLTKLFPQISGYIGLSYLALLYAYIARFLTLGYKDVNSAYKKIPSEFIAISECSCEKLTSKIRLIVPLISNSLIVFYLLIFIEIVKELPATLFIKPDDFETLATRTFELAMSGHVKESSITSLAIILINVLAIYFLSKNFTYKDGVKWRI